MIDPEEGRKILSEYQATTPIEQQIENVRRWSPELAERMGLNESSSPCARNNGGFAASLPRSGDPYQRSVIYRIRRIRRCTSSL